MAASKITNEMILQRIVEKCIKKKLYVTRLDKSIIPQNVNDLPPNMRVSSHIEYKRAYHHLYHINRKLEGSKSIKKVAQPMKAYREVTRTGRVNEDTFLNLVNEYRQTLNLVRSTLTPDGAIEMYWETKS